MLSVVGEFGAVVAPASRNGLFAAVGVRLRYLPIRPAGVPEAPSCMVGMHQSAGGRTSAPSQRTRAHFANAIQRLKDERRYRVFIDLDRDAVRFPTAVWRPNGSQEQREVTIWCSNDYLGMGGSPKGSRGRSRGGGAPRLAAPATFRDCVFVAQLPNPFRRSQS